MDSVTATAAAPALAASQVTETYNWGGRQRAQFQADMDQQAKATGSDQVQLGFKDMVDLVNPLQHIPVISSIYQAVTGDNTMNPAVKTVGDTIYGGPIGGLASIADNIFKASSGKDMLTTFANAIGIGDDDSATQVASAAPAAPDNSAAPITVAAAAPATAPSVTAAAPVTTPATVKPMPFAMAAVTSLPPVAGNLDVAGSSQTAANTSAPNSQLFNSLQKGAAPEGQVINASATPKFFNPNAQKFTGITPASFKPSKDIANTPASIGMQANMQVNDIMQSTAKSSQQVAANSMAQAGNHLPATAANANASGDTVQNPQSEFSQKMLAALDRYQAAKKAGDTAAAPTVTEGL